MKSSRISKWLKVVLPPLVIASAVGLTVLFVSLRPDQERKDPVAVYPKVEVHVVKALGRPLVIESQGTVRPRRQTRLTARVSGHIEWVSSSFYEGGTIQEGESLLRLDPLPYRSALAEARSRLALAQTTLVQEKEASLQARRDWESMGRGEPSSLVLREPQLIMAQANLEAAEVAVQMAEDNLSYTEIRAPYDGRVEAKHVDIGQAITAQSTNLAEVYSTDSVEIPVPLSLDELSFIDLRAPSPEPDRDPEAKPQARVSTVIAGLEHHWSAYLDRTAATVDARTRMITGIVRREAPLASENGLPLKPGMFVKVEIEARPMEGLIEVPRAALHPGDVVYRLTDENRLESVSLDILYTDRESVIVAGNLEEGDRLCITPLLFFVEGMHVEIIGAEPEQAGSPLKS